MSLFPASSFRSPVKGFVSNLPKCEACQLYKGCDSPKMEADGGGRKGILIVGEAPGAKEDQKGKPFVGKSGQKLREVLLSCGIDMRRDCWLTNSVICRPEGNATPTGPQIEYCRPNLLKTIRETDPKAILVLGGPAVEAVIGHVWKGGTGGIMRWAGFAVPNHKPNAWICPTYHPSYVLRATEDKNRGGEPFGVMVERRFREHVAECVRRAADGRPWPDGPPDYPGRVRLVRSPRIASEEIVRITASGDPCSFDYETNMLKPDSEAAEIVCASICRKGEETIAFPWCGEVADAFREFLKADAPRIGFNISFEERWSVAKLGVKVKGFRYAKGGWCGMQAAHVADHRKHITSAKFQAFVRLGMPDYSSHVTPFLESAGPSVPNRIREVDMDSLLKYCGLDSLLEYDIAQDQSAYFGWHKGWD